ncbi:hypothetical protein VUR80DRAFT_9896 [Thermomyces stellatus]
MSVPDGGPRVPERSLSPQIRIPALAGSWRLESKSDLIPPTPHSSEILILPCGTTQACAQFLVSSALSCPGSVSSSTERDEASRWSGWCVNGERCGSRRGASPGAVPIPLSRPVSPRLCVSRRFQDLTASGPCVLTKPKKQSLPAQTDVKIPLP